MKILGISGSPVDGGNTHGFLDRALLPARKGGHKVELVQLAGKQVGGCLHCDWCLSNTDPKRICSLEDDAEQILHQIKAADVLVIASPVHFARLSGQLACLIDRTRPLLGSPAHAGCMTDRPGVALAVGGRRNSGSETTLLSIIYAYLGLQMIPVSSFPSGALFGAAGVSNPHLAGAERGDRHAAASDRVGVKAAGGAVQRAIELAQRLAATK